MSYFSRIFKTGAVRKTPAKIIKRILDELPFQDSIRILELGAGRGEISLPLKKRFLDPAGANNLLFAIELEQDFARVLQTQMPNANVLQGNALEFTKLVADRNGFDYIVSSMPLSFFSPQEKQDLFIQLLDDLKPGGKLLILYHAPWLTGLLRKTFTGGRVIRFATIPPYFLFVYSKPKENL